LPVAFSALNSASCWPGKLISVRDLASPLMSHVSPTASTMTSERDAVATASAKPSLLAQPGAQACA
jgi:hypothetical protein